MSKPIMMNLHRFEKSSVEEPQAREKRDTFETHRRKYVVSSSLSRACTELPPPAPEPLLALPLFPPFSPPAPRHTRHERSQGDRQ